MHELLVWTFFILKQPYLSQHTLCIMGKMIRIVVFSKLHGAAWLLRDQENMLLTDNIMLWLPPYPLRCRGLMVATSEKPPIFLPNKH